MYTVSAPTHTESARIRDLAMLMRCFDRNGGTNFALPTTDPHGRPLLTLTDAQLREVASWCMTDEFHEAVSRERKRRHEQRTALSKRLTFGPA